MRSRLLSPVLLVGVFAGALAMPASATSLCHEGDEAERVVEQAQAEAQGALEELILPCAMVESDQLGPWCVDAAVYLVTMNGTLLCRVSLPAVDLTASNSPDLQERDPAPAPQRAPLQAPSGSLASAVKDAARPLVLERASSPHRTRQPPRPVYAEPPLVPG